MVRDPTQLVDHLAETWGSIGALCDELEPADWERSSGCPGWRVLDVLSHVVGLELELNGRPPAEAPVRVGDPPWVRDEFGRHMELAVWHRRGAAAGSVVGEFRDVIPDRVSALRRRAAECPEDEVLGVMGLSGPLDRFVQIRLFDCFLHEQDMRRATGRPGHLEGAAAEFCVSMMARIITRRVPEQAGLGAAAVELRIDGGPAPSVVLGEEGADPPSSVASMPLATFLALGSGRSDADLASVRVDGDQQLAERVLGNMSITP